MNDENIDSGDSPSMAVSPDSDRWQIILNPTSGTEDHVEKVRSYANDRGYAVTETEQAGDAIELGKDAAQKGVSRLAACGGDGTIHQVVEGYDEAGSLSDVTFGVIPAGTGNNFAQNLGIERIERAFELLETGERRQIDVGVADDELFTNSCIAGITAKTSSETDSDLKERFGTLAYVLTGIRQAAEFDPLHVEIDTGTAVSGSTWQGEALCILIGNARRFAGNGGQANAEDGLFEVLIVEEMPTNDLLTEAAIQRWFGTETEHMLRFTSDHLEITNQRDTDVEFSLDGEIRAHQELSLHIRPRELEIVVGPEYSPEPE
ncbi:diacylglycerol/lipid kinase family protein [Halocatena pleomorpha]|uniref:Diacylglycerol kinase family lipid kinase n=1 Tax=Halocatena pleomorpha TaxID=1785090 RepID=A0A3P3R545_9EURY|nr:diacylglycerol kinase family protein [Halocatena pleomorpha]RRJ27770.1 diacylglycerol kinase family lipid kinase [Halocatena pleomorpha]